MPWDRRFGVPIALLDGRTITTLSDAREVLLTVTPTATWRRPSSAMKARISRMRGCQVLPLFASGGL
jgi:hypothetical protein